MTIPEADSILTRYLINYAVDLKRGKDKNDRFFTPDLSAHDELGENDICTAFRAVIMGQLVSDKAADEFLSMVGMQRIFQEDEQIQDIDGDGKPEKYVRFEVKGVRPLKVTRQINVCGSGVGKVVNYDYQTLAFTLDFSAGGSALIRGGRHFMRCQISAVE